jgi:ABC-type nickel/cobalt efflux system permease component RcnA
MLRLLHISRRAVAISLVAAMLIFGFAAQTIAHPLGNFTINHFARIEVGGENINIRYVVDMAEIPTFQELQSLDVDSNGKPTSAALEAYLERVAQQYAAALMLTVNGTRVPLEISAKRISMPAGVGGLPTLRVECDLTGKALTTNDAGATTTHLLQFEDTNYAGRTGWREIVVTPVAGVTIFNSTAYGSPLTDELKTYPEDQLSAPLDERAAKLSWTRGAVPAGSTALLKRDGRPATQSRDMFAELMSREDLTLGVALLSLLMAVGLGALHAFSPGHGKTVVGAYLVGSRGTPRHAVFLGLTVTITHTLGVFALGLVTLFASQYIVPERLFPILGVVSGAIVVVIGLSLFARRLRVALGRGAHDHANHSHGGAHAHDHTHDGHEHSAHHHDIDPTIPHSHDGGSEHTHLPPGADGSAITWKSLLALGISGGLLPCPSALVVLLSAITMQRVGFGILLVIAFSIGLAATLTGVGLAFLYAGRFFKRPKRFASGRLVRVLPAVSAFVIMCVGLLICYEALVQGGFNLSAMFSQLGSQTDGVDISGKGALVILGIGLVFGLKHATEVDHVVAVSTIVSEHRNLRRAALVGGLWGAGHTLSLIVVGVVVLAFRVAIPELVSGWLEFGVALMIIGLGINAFIRALRRRSDIHVHQHGHDGTAHAHIHFHDKDTEHSEPVTEHSHASTRVGIKPFLVGAMHGLAGSAALTLLILTQIESPVLGLLYLAVFGCGSIIGMLLMSGLVALPFIFSARKLTGIHYGLQAVAGVLSIAFGFWYAYQSGIASGLFGKTF